jgi:predicted transcriptional regulator of viral defense system
MGRSRSLVIKSIDYYKKRKEIASPAKGFYVIVSPEYRVYGCLPAEYFIPYLMTYWHQNYYAGLLTAAAYHGAAHQRPQVFQVITHKKKRLIHCGKIKIIFSLKKNFSSAAIEKFSTAKSILTIATPEQTAIDLLLYPERSGGLNHIATILTELSEKIDAKKLLNLLKKHPHGPWKQRLGYLFDKLKKKNLADGLAYDLKRNKRIDHAPLVPRLKNISNQSNTKWKLIINSDIEIDV